MKLFRKLAALSLTAALSTGAIGLRTAAQREGSAVAVSCAV